MSAALTGTRSIAVSYGIVIHPTPNEFIPAAHTLASQIIQHLISNWTKETDLYNINIPLIQTLLNEEGMEIYWTTLWRNTYSRLFKEVKNPTAAAEGKVQVPAGPSTAIEKPPNSTEGELVFKWSPDMKHLINPEESALPPGSDAWALHHKAASVTPLSAGFAEPAQTFGDVGDRQWKWKL